MSEMNLYWGDMHDNILMHDDCPVTAEQTFASARSHLDFYAPAYYTAEGSKRTANQQAPDASPLSIGNEAWKSSEKLERQWQEIEHLTQRFNEPGRFITFPGYEWQGNGIPGDHNVIHRREGGQIFPVDTLEALYEHLRGSQAIAIPHHIGYRVGARGKDWEVHDETLSPFAEIYSVHGSSETDEEGGGLRINMKMGPGTGGSTYQDALNRGYHLGAIGSPDGDGTFPGCYDWGLMACLAPELSREALWEAFTQRRVYGVSGDRIALDFKVNHALMGQRIAATGARRIEVGACGADAIDRIELLRDERVIHTINHQGTWRVPASGQRGRFKLRIEAGWGMLAREVGPQPPRHWHGRLTLPASARFTATQPCWISGDQNPPSLSGSSAQFTLVSPQVEPAKLNVQRHQNAHVFEFEADPDDELHVEIDGLQTTARVADLCQASRVLTDTEQAQRTLTSLYGIEPAAAQRPRMANLYAHKVKLHRIIPEAGYTASMRFEDEGPLQHETHYRVRVQQRNGQRAWSSPIWVTPSQK